MLATGTAIATFSAARYVVDHKRLVEWRSPPSAEKWTAIALVIFFIPLAGSAILNRYVRPMRINPQAEYGLLFSDLVRQNIGEVLIVDHGIPNRKSNMAYQPMFLFYRDLWQLNGLIIEHASVLSERNGYRTGEVVGTCDPRYLEAVVELGDRVAATRDCAAVQIKSGSG